ncbi:hypothetical protein [Campylobacter sp.]|nr:hypothetical protein [Campylobacter sp.]MDY4154305.1 hypothetical protein [Campylobacter sp.]
MKLDKIAILASHLRCSKSKRVRMRRTKPAPKHKRAFIADGVRIATP